MSKRRYTGASAPKSGNPNKSIAQRINDGAEIVPLCGKINCPITLWGNGQIIIEQVKELRRIDDSVISVAAGKGCVTVTGAYLTLCSVNEQCVVVKGEIWQVGFEVE